MAEYKMLLPPWVYDTIHSDFRYVLERAIKEEQTHRQILSLLRWLQPDCLEHTELRRLNWWIPQATFVANYYGGAALVKKLAPCAPRENWRPAFRSGIPDGVYRIPDGALTYWDDSQREWQVFMGPPEKLSSEFQEVIDKVVDATSELSKKVVQVFFGNMHPEELTGATPQGAVGWCEDIFAHASNLIQAEAIIGDKISHDILVQGARELRPKCPCKEDIPALQGWCRQVYSFVVDAEHYLAYGHTVKKLMKDIQPWEPEASWTRVQDEEHYILPDGTYIRWDESEMSWDTVPADE